MNLSAPTTIVFWISVILFILSLLAQYVPDIGGMIVLKPLYWGWLAWIVLAAGNVMKGL